MLFSILLLQYIVSRPCRYSAASFWRYISFVITLKQPCIYQNLWTYVWGCFDLLCPGSSGGTTGVPNLFLLKSCLSFPFSWIKSSRVLVLLIFSGGDWVGTFLLEPHLTQYLYRALQVLPNTTGKSMIRFPPSWIDLTSFCPVLDVHGYIKNRDFWEHKSWFLEWNQDF